MIKRIHKTRCGNIHYWVSDKTCEEDYTLLLLPGLTADHRLFEKQVEAFEGRCNLFVWDAPAHAKSWPFSFDFTLLDKARWLNEIIEKEGFKKLILVGQSMGAYVGQSFCEMYPDKLLGFISIDSAPLGREYITAFELFLLRKTEKMYLKYPWEALLKSGSDGVAVTQYGKRLMKEMMMEYDGDQKRYARLAGHGFNMLADAYNARLKYEIKCKALLICGEDDTAGSTRKYNKAWHKRTGIPIEWIKCAGHNSNADQPEKVNALIEGFVNDL